MPEAITLEEFPTRDSSAIFEAVHTMEEGDRTQRHNNPGAHIWTEELSNKFTAKKGDPLPSNPSLHTAKYKDLNTGVRASKYIIDKVWNRARGDIDTFASLYALGKKKPETDEEKDIVSSYKKLITRSLQKERKVEDQSYASESAPAPTAEGNVVSINHFPSSPQSVTSLEDFPSLEDNIRVKETRNIDPFTNFSRAVYKTLVPGTVSAYQELFKDHQTSVNTMLEAEKEMPTRSGFSQFLGSVVGGIVPTAAALLLPGKAVTIPLVLTHYGLEAAGQGKGAVKAYEQKSGEDVSPETEALVATGYGLAVFLAERMGFGGLEGVINKMGRRSLQRIGAAYAEKNAAKTATIILGEAGKIAPITAVIEGTEEATEQTMTNAIDALYNPDKRTWQSLLEDVPESAMAGAAGGALLGFAGGTARSIIDRETLIEMAGTDRVDGEIDPQFKEDEKDDEAYMKGLPRMLHRIQKMSKISAETLHDQVSVEAPFRRTGAPRTGRAFKTYNSKRTLHEDTAVSTIGSIYKAILKNTKKKLFGRGKEARKRFQDLTFLYENKKKWDSLSDSEKAPYKEAYDILDNYVKMSFNEYEEAGGLQQTFKERMRGDLEAQLEKLVSENKTKTKKQRAELRKLQKDLDKLDNTNFLPLPSLWFETLMKRKPHIARQVLNILGTRKRKFISIQDVLDFAKKNPELELTKEDIHLEEILGFYGRKKGRDLALLSILKEAKDEGLAVKPLKKKFKTKKEGGIPQDFVQPPVYMPFLRGYWIHSTMFDALDAMTRRSDFVGIPSKVLNITKMMQFYNPFFLPIYDLVQGVMLGSIARPAIQIATGASIGTVLAGPVGGAIGALGGAITMPSYVRAGIKDAVLKTREYEQSKGAGTFSTPFNNPMSDHLDMINSAVRQGGQIGSLLVDFLKAGVTLNIPKFIKTIYNMSWKTAWYLDNVVRQVSFRYGLEKGLSIEEAADQAALYHGDYASVPTKTRRRLNRLFFTPTFKIAMAKLMSRMIKGVGETINPTVRTSEQAKHNFFGFMRLTALLAAMDMLMLSIGYERDEFGRRYFKKVRTKEGEKELVLTWSAPHNMFLKYAYRFKDSMGPAVDNSLAHFIRSNTWEIHPLYRTLLDIVKNKTPGGEPIVSSFDPSLKYGKVPTKELKVAYYFLKNTVALLKGAEYEQAEARKLFAREHGKAWDGIARWFTFTYQRMPSDIRRAYEIRRLEALYTRDINSLIRRVPDMSNEEFERITDVYLERLDTLLEETDIVRDLPYDNTSEPDLSASP